MMWKIQKNKKASFGSQTIFQKLFNGNKDRSIENGQITLLDISSPGQQEKKKKEKWKREN